MVTCINDAMFPETGKAVVTLLRRLGVDVEFPAGQTCCAQPMVNTGYLDEAVPLVRTFVSAFEGYDHVVVPSGSCAGSVRHQHLGPGLPHVPRLVRPHRHRGVRVLHRERPPEAAALLGVRQVDES